MAAGASTRDTADTRVSVSPTVAEESLPLYGPFFAGMEEVPAARVVTAYVRSVEDAQTGQVHREHAVHRDGPTWRHSRLTCGHDQLRGGESAPEKNVPHG